MKTPSARYRRMVTDQRHRLLVKSWTFNEEPQEEIDLPTDSIGHARLEFDGDEMAEILSMVIDDNVDNYRKALAMMATDLLYVYDFMDEWETKCDRPTGYAKAQQVVLKALRARMSTPITDMLIETIMGHRFPAQT